MFLPVILSQFTRSPCGFVFTGNWMPSPKPAKPKVPTMCGHKAQSTSCMRETSRTIVESTSKAVLAQIRPPLRPTYRGSTAKNSSNDRGKGRAHPGLHPSNEHFSPCIHRAGRFPTALAAQPSPVGKFQNICSFLWSL